MNKFFSLAAGLMISLAGYAQDPAVTLTDANDVSTEYTVGVVNNNGNNVQFQLLADGNVAFNATYKVNQNRFVIGGATYICTGSGYTGFNNDNELTVSDAAQAVIGNAGCSSYDDGFADGMAAACPGAGFSINGTDYVVTAVTEQDNGVFILSNTLNGVPQTDALLFPDNGCFYTFDFACPNDNGDYIFINGQGVLTPNDALRGCTGLEVEPCPEDLTDELESCEASNAYLTSQVQNLDGALTTVTNNLDDCNATVDQLNDSINGLELTISQQLQTINITQFALDNCFGDNNQLEAELAAALATIAELNDIIEDKDNVIAMFNDVVLDLNDELNAQNTTCQQTIQGLEEDILVLEYEIIGLNTQLSDCSDAVAYNNDLYQGALADAAADAALYNDTIVALTGAVNGLLEDVATAADDLAVAEDEVLYWMDAYGDAVVACEEAVAAEYGTGFADGQTVGYNNGYEHGLAAGECGFACFETEAELEFFYDGAFHAGVLSVECTSVDDAYDYGYENGLTDGVNSVPACEYNYGDVMEAFYNGYDLGLGDCQGEVTGILDIDGNTVTQVVGYYNEIGQVIDPRGYTGLVIRRHADGTFSKYYVGR